MALRTPISECDLCSYYHTQHHSLCPCAYCYRRNTKHNASNPNVKEGGATGEEGTVQECVACRRRDRQQRVEDTAVVMLSTTPSTNTSSSSGKGKNHKRRRRVHCYYDAVPVAVIPLHNNNYNNNNKYSDRMVPPPPRDEGGGVGVAVVGKPLEWWQIPKIGDCSQRHLRERIIQSERELLYLSALRAESQEHDQSSHRHGDSEDRWKSRWLSERRQFMY